MLVIDEWSAARGTVVRFRTIIEGRLTLLFALGDRSYLYFIYLCRDWTMIRACTRENLVSQK